MSLVKNYLHYASASHTPTCNCKYIPNLHRLQVNLASFSSVGTSVQCRQGNKVFFKCTYKQTYCTYVLAQLICMAARANVVGASGCTAGCALPHCMATRTLRNYIAYAVHLRIPTLHGNARSGQLQLAMLCICAFPHCMVTRALGNYGWHC